MKHISKEGLDFDTAFLKEALDEQKRELQRLSDATRVRISLANEDIVPAP